MHPFQVAAEGGVRGGRLADDFVQHRRQPHDVGPRIPLPGAEPGDPLRVLQLAPLVAELALQGTVLGHVLDGALHPFDPAGAVVLGTPGAQVDPSARQIAELDLQQLVLASSEHIAIELLGSLPVLGVGQRDHRADVGGVVGGRAAEELREHRALIHLAGFGVVHPAADLGDPLRLDQPAPFLAVADVVLLRHGLGQVRHIEQHGNAQPLVVGVRPAQRADRDPAAARPQQRHRPVAHHQVREPAADQGGGGGFAGQLHGLLGRAHHDPVLGAQQGWREGQRDQREFIGAGAGKAETAGGRPVPLAPLGQQHPSCVAAIWLPTPDARQATGE